MLVGMKSVCYFLMNQKGIVRRERYFKTPVIKIISLI